MEDVLISIQRNGVALKGTHSLHCMYYSCNKNMVKSGFFANYGFRMCICSITVPTALQPFLRMWLYSNYGKKKLATPNKNNSNENDNNTNCYKKDVITTRPSWDFKSSVHLIS